MHTTEDPELLTETGIEQITKTAEKLKEFNPIKIYSSQEARAVQSGKLIADILGVDFETIDDMRERNWGDWSDRSWSEVQEILEPMNLQERYTFIPPRGESWEHFEKRLIQSINSLLGKHWSETIVVVSHGGAIRALMPYLLSVPKEESFKYSPDNASLTVFNMENGIAKPVTLNDTSHLKG